MKPTIAAVILTKNEELMLANCIETVRWCDEIWVVDNGSTDATLGIAQKLGAKIMSCMVKSFAEQRQIPLAQITADWVFYIDADERVVPRLAQEIQVQAETTTANALVLHRENMMYGQVFHSGGWSEQIARVFRRTALQGWKGDVHETAQFRGDAVALHTPLLHLTHRNTIDGLHKTISWTPIEARLLYEASQKPISLKTILRKGILEFLRRGVLWRGYKDGQTGWIEALVQGINRMLVYIQVWELQQKPSLVDRYAAEEMRIAELWKKNV